jgi:hypothetical protein
VTLDTTSLRACSGYRLTVEAKAKLTALPSCANQLNYPLDLLALSDSNPLLFFSLFEPPSDPLLFLLPSSSSKYHHPPVCPPHLAHTSPLPPLHSAVYPPFAQPVLPLLLLLLLLPSSPPSLLFGSLSSLFPLSFYNQLSHACHLHPILVRLTSSACNRTTFAIFYLYQCGFNSIASVIAVIAP